MTWTPAIVYGNATDLHSWEDARWGVDTEEGRQIQRPVHCQRLGIGMWPMEAIEGVDEEGNPTVSYQRIPDRDEVLVLCAVDEAKEPTVLPDLEAAGFAVHKNLTREQMAALYPEHVRPGVAFHHWA